MDVDDADRALAEAVAARAALGLRPNADEDAIGLRALLEAAGSDAREALRAVWGRLDAAASGPISVWGGVASVLAADRYGAKALKMADTPEAALKAASLGGRAVLDLNRSAWWGRLLAQPDLRIVAALPDAPNGHPLAAVVERRVGGPTGDDRTFWVTDAAMGAAGIIDHFSMNGLAAELMLSLGGLKLFSLAGYVQAHDARISTAPGRLSGVIGSAPVF